MNLRFPRYYVVGCVECVVVLATFGKTQWVLVKMAEAEAGYVAVCVVRGLHFDLSVSKSI